MPIPSGPAALCAGGAVGALQRHRAGERAGGQRAAAPRRRAAAPLPVRGGAHHHLHRGTQVGRRPDTYLLRHRSGCPVQGLGLLAAASVPCHRPPPVSGQQRSRLRQLSGVPPEVPPGLCSSHRLQALSIAAAPTVCPSVCLFLHCLGGGAVCVPHAKTAGAPQRGLCAPGPTSSEPAARQPPSKECRSAGG